MRWIWAIAVVTAACLLLSNDSIKGYIYKKRQLRRLQKQLEEMKAANKNLTFEIRRIKQDPRVLEEHARKELGMLQPGEIEYRFVVKRST